MLDAVAVQHPCFGAPAPFRLGCAALIFLSAISPLTIAASDICYINRVILSEPMDARSQATLKVFANWPWMSIRHRDGTSTSYNPSQARTDYFRKVDELLKASPAEEMIPSMPEDAKEPNRFTLVEGDEASASIPHNACTFSAKVKNGVLGLEAKATHCMHGQCQTSGQFIVPQRICNIERVALTGASRGNGKSPGLLVFANWPHIDIKRRDGTSESRALSTAREQYFNALRQLKPEEPFPPMPEDAREPKRFSLSDGDEARVSVAHVSCSFKAATRDGRFGVEVKETLCAPGTCTPETAFVSPGSTPP